MVSQVILACRGGHYNPPGNSNSTVHSFHVCAMANILYWNYGGRAEGGYIGNWLQRFRDYPPRQKPGSFNLDRVMEAVTRGAGDK